MHSYIRNLAICGSGVGSGVGNGVFQNRLVYQHSSSPIWVVKGGIIGPSGNLYVMDGRDVYDAIMTKFDSSYNLIWTTYVKNRISKSNFALSPDESSIFFAMNDNNFYNMYILDASNGALLKHYKM